MKKLTLLILMTMMIYTSSTGQPNSPAIGLFEGFSDIGHPALKGSVQYSEPGQEYQITGSGENIWYGTDSFSFLWKRMESDYMIQAEMAFVGEGTDPHRKAGLMIRNGLTADAAHVSCVIHGDGLTALQYRKAAGEDMEQLKFDISGPGVLQLEKKGNLYTVSVAHRGEVYLEQTLELELEGPMEVGLFVCSHNVEVFEEATFSNVRIFGTVPDDLVQYESYIGSLMETMDLETGTRSILAGDPGSWQAPNWHPDGNSLIYNADGLLYNFDLQSRKSTILNSDFANRNNNDHVISFDGKKMAISHHAEKDEGRSAVYTLPLEGGTPVRITPLSPSYLHGWSADDTYLVYTAERNGAYNIFRIPSEGGEEVQLTDTPTLDDGPEYSPDGKYIYFNSTRTGTMQIWRMDPDGGNQTQITDDPYNNWFPHISPDGKWIVYISFPPEVPAGSHPFYERVYLKVMSVDELKPEVVAYLYGGQGTINVPSWSPDSRKIAFVSNGIFSQ
jgi:TolB protein